MQVSGKWRTSALVVAGLFVGSIVGPPIVQAATSLVTIQGAGTTNKAKVNGAGQLLVNNGASATKASQLQTTEAAPSSFTDTATFGSFGCSAVATAPVGKGLIVKEIIVDVWQNGTPGSGDYVAFSVNNPACDFATNTVVDLNPDHIGQYVYPLDPGIALKSGDKLYGYVNEGYGVEIDAQVLGYTVPSADVPSSTLSSAHISRPSSPHHAFSSTKG